MPSTSPGGAAGTQGSDRRSPGTTRTGPRRRALLAGTAGALLVSGTAAGCTGEGESPEERRRRADASQRLRREAAEDSGDLLTRYASTAAVHPSLDGLLAPLREATSRHVEALAGPERSRGGETGRGGTGNGDGPAGGPGTTRRTAVPGDERRALTALAAAERRTADARMRALVDAPPELARLLASVAAAGSVHAMLLTEGRAR